MVLEPIVIAGTVLLNTCEAPSAGVDDDIGAMRLSAATVAEDSTTTPDEVLVDGH